MTEDLLSRSRYALLTGDLLEAEALCLKAVENDPDNTESRLLLGSIFIRVGKLQSAQKVFEDLISSEPDNVDAIINSAIVYQKRGKLKTALNAAQNAYKLAGDRADIIFNIGNIHRQLGELTKAEQIYRLALKKNPEFVSTYSNLALLLSDAGRNSEAVEILKQGLSIDENNPGLHFNLANMYRQDGEADKAVSEYRKALKIQPGWEECLLNLGDLIRKDNPDEASRLYRNVMELSPESPEAKCRIGEIAFDKGESDEAEVIFTKLLTESPLYTPAAVNLAAVYYSGKKITEAEKLLRDHQVNDPENNDLRLLLGNILLDTGKYNEAFINIKWVLDRNESDSRAWFAMARQFSLSGKKDRALNTYRKGLNLNPAANDARLQLALLLKSLDKIDEAITECELIYKNSPEDFAPALLLAEMYLEKEYYKKAADIIENLSAANPDDLRLLQMFAETARKAGLTEKALKAAEALAAAGDENTEDFDLDELTENLQFYDEMAVEYAKEYGSSWSRNLKALARTFEPEPKHEEASFLFDGLQDIAGEYVPILDVGGIDPVILFDEEEEVLTLTDEDEFIPPPEDDEEPPVEEIEKHEEASQTGPAAPKEEAPAGWGGGPLNISSPLTIKLETPSIIVKRPEPEPEPEEEVVCEAPEIFEEEPEEEPDNLFDYLDKLTKFLPEEKRSEYQDSETRLKLASLKSKLDGDPGIISRIQNEKTSEELSADKENTVKLTKDKIGTTLNFMTGLTGALPDSKIAESLGDKLKHILSRLEEQKEEADDKIN